MQQQHVTGGDLGAAPLATLPTNSTAKVAAGRYDLLVHLTAPKQPHAETLLSGVNLRPGRNGDLVADLSDGSLIAQATENGRYAEVLYAPGGRKRAYALNNVMEYFAEGSEAYWGVNDFYPFVRAELEEQDPVLYGWMKKVWVMPEGDAAAEEAAR